MKRRSRAGGQPIKGRRTKTPKLTRRNAPKALALPNSSPLAQTKVARHGRERDEACDQPRCLQRENPSGVHMSKTIDEKAVKLPPLK